MTSHSAAAPTPADRPPRWGWLSRVGDRLRVDVDPELRPAVEAEQLRMVLGHTRLGTLVATAFAVLFALQLRGGPLATWVVDVWLTAKLAVAAARIALSLRHERLGHPADRFWRNATDAWLLVDGLVWGVAGLLVVFSSAALAALVCAIMTCVGCVATFGLQTSKRSTAAYVAPILTLTAIGLMLRADEFGSIGAPGLVMLLGLVLTTAAASERRLVDGLQLRLRAEALTAEKDEALKLALRQSAVKTQFLANISHELRTPLHGILGVARLLHLEAGDSAVARRVELIESSGMHLLGLINDLLDISRLQAGRFAMRNERFELGALIETLGDVYNVRAGDKGLNFTLHMQIRRPCWVRGDPSRLRQVLHNLLGNAVKFTQRGSISLTVSHDPTTGSFRAEVQDSGPGIAPQDLAHVFEAFRQVGDADAQPFEGTGLGLTISRDIAMAMGGDLKLRSVLGAGTSAILTAQLSDAPHADPQQAREGEVPASNASGVRVLIAEDDDVNAVIAMAYLEHLGVFAERVRDGRQAVRHALREVNRPDLVLMDYRMPTMDGMSATKEIRTQERALGLARLPIIALTATSCDISRDQCLEAGMDDFLSKPYSQDELSRMLGHWVARHAPVTAAG